MGEPATDCRSYAPGRVELLANQIEEFAAADRAVDVQNPAVEPHSVNHVPPMLASLLDALVSDIRDVLGDDLVGLYLWGSAVSGGFDPGVSDLDLVAVTRPEVGEIDLADLERMHVDFVRRNPEWSDRLEIVYIGRATLQSFRTSSGSLAVISPGEPFHVPDERPAAWLQNWYLLRETGVTLHGADVTEVVPPISRSEFVTAVVRYAEEVRHRSAKDPSPGSLAYAILTLCRALQNVRTQVYCSKQEAAALTRERIPEWAWLIDAALRARLSRGTTGFDDEQTRAAAQRFIGILADEIAAASA